MANSKWQDAIDEAQREGTEGFVAVIKAELIPQAVPVKGIGIVPFDPDAHAGVTPRKAAKITCETRQNIFSRTMFLASEEFRVLHESVQALGLTMDDIEAGLLARIVSRPLVRANGQPVTYTARDGTEKVKTAWALAEVIEPDDHEHDEPPPSRASYYPPPQNAAEQAATRILELAYARLPADVTNEPAKLIAALGSKRRNDGIRDVSDSRLLELAALTINRLRGPDELPF